MKKRLSEERWITSPVFLALFSIFACVIAALRIVSLSWNYATISGTIPVVLAPLKDPATHTFEESPRETLSSTTPVVFLTASAFYFGNMQAFTKDFYEVRNKFVIPHVDGAPQFGAMTATMARWMQETHNDSRVVILNPTSEIPMPIVLQIMNGLKKSGMFDDVVLSGGLS